ncbi:MAG: transporter ATP-binding protein YtrB [Verrucomicrobiota bacterium]|jgi:ABC-2 type transport system ATP-binding protein
MNYAIQAQRLSKAYAAGKPVLDGLELRVPQGSVYGLVGPNGAGKTTLLRCLMGLISPDLGQALILGQKMQEASSVHRQLVAYVSQSIQLHGWMNLQEHALYLRHFYSRFSCTRVNELAETFKLDPTMAISALSGGQQRLAAVSLALASYPKVLILDEPAAGLDPKSRHLLLQELARGIADTEGCSVLLSTHLLADLERFADTVGFLKDGKIVREEKLEVLQNSITRLQISFLGRSEVPADFVLPGMVLRSQKLGPVLSATLRLDDPAALDSLREDASLQISTQPLSLEEIYVEDFDRG